MRMLFFLLLIINSFAYAQISTQNIQEGLSDTLKPEITFLLGPQFNEGVNSTTSIIVGVATNLYKKNNLIIPLELMVQYLHRQNVGENILIPRIIANLKSNIFSVGQTKVYIQGGIGLPVYLFPYLFDFNPVLGVSYKKLQIEIRNIFFFDLDGEAKASINRWPMVAIILGLTL